MSDFKDKGNAALKSGDLNAALGFYSQAINSEPANHIHYSNRSLCHFKMGNFAKASEDASKCIELNKSWSKGYQRRGAAEAKLGNSWNSLVSYSYGSIYDPDNAAINEE